MTHDAPSHASHAPHGGWAPFGIRTHRLPLPWYGTATGVVLHLYRCFVLAVIVPRGWGAVIGTLALGVVLLCAASAAHLANHAPHSWRWRAPALGAFIALGEALTSLVLIAAGAERIGRATAVWGDWPQLALSILLSRVLVVALFALVLAVMVKALTTRTEGRG